MVVYGWVKRVGFVLRAWPGLSAVHVGPAGGVRMEVVLAQAGRVVGGGEHIAGWQRGGEVVARLVVHMEIVLV